MNLGQYQRCSRAPVLPMGFQYDDSQSVSSQPNDQMQHFDGLPRFPLENEFLAAWPSTINSYNLAAQTPSAQTSTDWINPAFNSPNIDDAALANSCGYYYHYPSIIPRPPQQDPFSLDPPFDGVPRTWQLAHDARMPGDGHSPKPYEASNYLRDHGSDEASPFPLFGSALPYDHHDRSRDFERLSMSRSPKMENDTVVNAQTAFDNAAHSRMYLSEPSDDSGTSSREMTAVDLEDPGADEPYAKLIYRALMSTPDHAMVLQEIYQWFRDNTAKGSSDTKGWMNSIRHNLSMNAVRQAPRPPRTHAYNLQAFRKSERRVSGDETKKSTEWVLEDFAIRDGVQSTTRYRKGTGNKKHARSEHPTPTRQTSGRKGGFCASKTKSQRQKAKEERPNQRVTSRAEAPRQLQLHSQAVTQRQVSPLTPPNLENISSPYFFSKSEQLDMSYDDMYGLEDVQGVYIDDHGPLFSGNSGNSQQPPFDNKHCLDTNPF